MSAASKRGGKPVARLKSTAGSKPAARSKGAIKRNAATRSKAVTPSKPAAKSKPATRSKPVASPSAPGKSAAVSVGRKVPDFTLPATGGGSTRSKDLLGGKVVLYFYPRDSTPGCTLEGQQFAQLAPQFASAGATVLGISRDSIASHEKFRAKMGFPFALLSDSAEVVCKLFDVIREKNMYGRKVLGIERSTFLIDAQGVLRREWRAVKVEGHALEVLTAAQAL